MASDTYNDMAELVDNVRLLKNQQEASLKKQQAQLKEFLDTERSKSGEILSEQKKIIKELKQEKRKTYAKYFFVGFGCLSLGLSIATFGCFTYSNWINKNLIETRAQLKIEAEQQKIEAEQLKEKKAKYDRFEKYNELLVLFEKFNSKDQDAVSIFSGTNYLEKTFSFSDKKEDVLVLKIKQEFMSECVDEKQKCYRDPNKKDYSFYYGFFETVGNDYLMSFKKNP